MATSTLHKGWLYKHGAGILGGIYNQAAFAGAVAHGANTALDGVLRGTPVTPALAVDSMVLSNLVNNGDILIAASTGSNSQAWLWVDSSAGVMVLYAAGVEQVRTSLGNFVVNEGSADINFRVETDGLEYAIYSDGGTNSVVLGSNTDTSSADKRVVISRAARTATSNASYYDLTIEPAGAVTITGATTSAVVASVNVNEPNITATGTVTTAATIYIGTQPTEGTDNGAIVLADGLWLALGTNADGVLANEPSTLANTGITGVLEGTPVTPAIAANTLVISNTTANGDVLLATNLGGNSNAWLWVDTSLSIMTLYAVGVSAIELAVGTVVVNEGSADIDFRVEAANNGNALVIDGGTDSMSLGRAVVAGAFLAIDGSAVNRAGVTSVGRHVHIPAVTITQTNANPTTLAIGAGMFVGIPTFDGANAGQTLTDSASVYISGEPAAGSGNMTLTRVYSLWVDAGTTALDGRTIVGGNLAAPIHDINIATLVAFNEQGSDIDFRVESDNNPNALLVDAGTDSLGFGNGVTAGAFLSIVGDTNARAMTTNVGMNLHFPLVTLMSNNANPTTIAIGAAISVLRPSFDGSNAGQTTSDGAAVYIQNSPVAGSANMTITRAWSIWVDAGNSRFDGNIDMSYLASDIVMGAAAAAALEISDGTTKFLAFDTRVATAGVTTIALDISDYTFASGATNVATGLSLAAHTLNYTGATQVTSEVITASLGGRTIASDTATLTVDKATTLKLVAPVEGTNVTLTAASALRIGDAGGTPTNQYGIFIETLTAGATADYAIWVAGANAVHLGTAGTATGLLEIDGATSGTMTLTVPTATTSYTLTLPPAANTNVGYQLTCAAGDTITSWGAAASVRGVKDIIGEHEAQDALDKMLAAKVYDFHYKPGKGTQDSTTQYVGVMADEAPWAMHYAGGIVNPVNTLGYTVLAFQAMAKEIAGLKKKLAKMGAN